MLFFAKSGSNLEDSDNIYFYFVFQKFLFDLQKLVSLHLPKISTVKTSPSGESKYPLVRVTVSRETFHRLQESLLNAMRALGLDTDNPGSAKFYGMGEYSPSTPQGRKLRTIANIIAENEAVKAMLTELEKEGVNVKGTNFGDYLYKKANELRHKNDLETIDFVGKKYVYGYFKFLGFNSLEEFEESIYSTEAHAERRPEAPQDAEEWNYYIGAYFSLKSFGVRRFVLAINFNRPTNNRYPAKEWGFHKLGDVSEQDLTTAQRTRFEYDGYATIVDKRWLCVQLEAKDNKNPFFLLGAVPDNILNIKKQRVIQSILLSVSVRHYPVSAEAVLIKTTREYASHAVSMHERLSPPILEESLSREESDIVKLYIMLQRRNFYTNPQIIESVMGLKAKGSSLNSFTYLQGVWRILNFGLQRGHVIQSVMVIEPGQFKAMLYPYLRENIAERSRNLTEQAIVFNISRIRQNKLCLISYGEPGMSVASYAIFDLETDNGGGFFEGCFISTGYDQNGIIGGYCVVQKVRDDNNYYLKIREMQKNDPAGAALFAEEHNARHLLDLKPMSISEENVGEFVEKYNLQPLYAGLKAIWKKKLWRQRKKYGDDYPFAPEVIKHEQTLYVLKKPLECHVEFKNGQIAISHRQLDLSVEAWGREEAERAFAAALHEMFEKYSAQGQANPMLFWVKDVVNLSVEV